MWRHQLAGSPITTYTVKQPECQLYHCNKKRRYQKAQEALKHTERHGRAELERQNPCSKQRTCTNTVIYVTVAQTLLRNASQQNTRAPEMWQWRPRHGSRYTMRLRVSFGARATDHHGDPSSKLLQKVPLGKCTPRHTIPFSLLHERVNERT